EGGSEGLLAGMDLAARKGDLALVRGQRGRAPGQHHVGLTTLLEQGHEHGSCGGVRRRPVGASIKGGHGPPDAGQREPSTVLGGEPAPRRWATGPDPGRPRDVLVAPAPDGYIIPMPPMPPMPPIPPAPAATGFSSGLSATRASVVSSRPAMDAAFCRAERVTFAGSMTPALKRSSNSPVSALRPTAPV